jgi:hypothetical protein
MLQLFQDVTFLAAKFQKIPSRALDVSKCAIFGHLVFLSVPYLAQDVSMQYLAPDVVPYKLFQIMKELEYIQKE